MTPGTSGRSPGMTFRSFGWLVLGLVVIAVITQFFGAVDAPASGATGVDAIALPVLMIAGLAVAVAAALRRLVRVGWLTPAEQAFVLYALLIAAPLMTSGFWRYFLKANAVVVRFNSPEFYDAISPRSWPHGPNLLTPLLEDPTSAGIATAGAAERRDFRVRGERSAAGYSLRNGPGEVSVVRFVVPVWRDGRLVMPLDQPYLFSALVRPDGLGPQSTYFARLIPGGSREPVELLRARGGGRASPLQPEAFLRVFKYGVPLAADRAGEAVTLEIGLDGEGTLDVADPEWINVFALEAAYTGRAGVTPEAYAALPAAARDAVVPLPTTMWSLAGLGTIVTGYVPWEQWRDPILFWGGYLSLLFLASLAFACLIRRQWLQSERFPLPLTLPTTALIEGGAFWHGGESWFRRAPFWIGFGVIGGWGGLMAWSSVNPAVPAPVVDVPLSAYFTSPAWMQAMRTTFSLSPLIFSLALFIDLTVLASLVVGFFLYRAQYIAGEAAGWSVNKDFPHGSSQIAGSTMMYALVIVWLARRYLTKVFRDALSGTPRPGEYLSPRAALGALALSFAGVALWAWWAELPVFVMLGMFALMFAFSVVAMRFRTELGVSDVGLFSHPTDGVRGGMLSLLVVLLGSFSVFGAEGMVFAGLLAIFFFSHQCMFWIIPGLQLEWLEIGRRLEIPRGHVLAGALLGLVGGLAIGGWIYLAGANAIGAENYPIPGHYNDAKNLLSVVSAESVSAPSGDGGGFFRSWSSGQGLAVAFGALGTMVVAALRQVFAGFWFHPAGFILGPSGLVDEAWGSLLLALLVRFLMLRLGGAAAIRGRLYPFAAGGVLAIAAVTALFYAVQAFQFFFDPTTVKANLDF